MDKFETPYDDDATFIKCTVCDKSLRGETSYKIHLTTAGHIKKEEGLLAAGLAVRQHTVPKFDNILSYLDYLNLDEPVIGLSFLEETPNYDPQFGPTYVCTLCNQTSVIAEMVSHVIGRKHRQKYMEVKRPDLVTWDSQTVRTQVGKIIRAKAEVIERQDGRGTPKSMMRKGVKSRFNISGVYPRQRQNRDTQDLPPLLPGLKDTFNRKNFSTLNNPSLHCDEPNRNRAFQGQDLDYRDYTGDELGRADYREDYIRPEYGGPSEEAYREGSQLSGVPEQQDGSRYGYREQMSRGQAQDHYPTEGPSYKRQYPEKDFLEEFYPGEAGRGQVHSQGYQSSQPASSDWNKCQWSMERDPSMNRSHIQDSSEREAKRRSLSTSLESDQSRDRLFQIIKDYHHEMRRPYKEEPSGNPGPSRGADSQRLLKDTGSVSNIPEPFRRFLKGGLNDEGKRPSRFSDASPDEMEVAKKMFSDGYGPAHQRTGGNPPSAGSSFRPSVSPAQNSDRYGGPQGPPFTKRYHTGGSESEDVFDVLKNIEIENAEEAAFLKNKLCSLLKEFKAKKEEKSALARAHQYERTHREDSDLRRPEELDFNNSQRGGWRQHEALPEESHQPPVHGEPRQSRHPSRGRYEDEPLRYPGRFQEPMRSRDQQLGVEFFDSRSSARPLHMEQGTQMRSNPSYSNNLDKFTSALLELVARK